MKHDANEINPNCVDATFSLFKYPLSFSFSHLIAPLTEQSLEEARGLCGCEPELFVLPKEPIDHVAVSSAGGIVVVGGAGDHGSPEVRAGEDRLGLGDDADEVEPQEVLDISDAQALILVSPLGVVPGDEEGLGYGSGALHGPPRHAGDETDHLVGVAAGGELGVSHNNGVISKVHGVLGAGLNTSGRIKDHIVELLGEGGKDVLNGGLRAVKGC